MKWLYLINSLISCLFIMFPLFPTDSETMKDFPIIIKQDWKDIWSSSVKKEYFFVIT